MDVAGVIGTSMVVGTLLAICGFLAWGSSGGRASSAVNGLSRHLCGVTKSATTRGDPTWSTEPGG